ncbi:hypothetical protein ACQPW3_11490 [Actinosynnema sp. CA-248983]
MKLMPVTASAAVRLTHHVHRITHTWELALAPRRHPDPQGLALRKHP